MKRLYFWYDSEFNQQKIIASSVQDVRKQLLLQGQFAIRIKPDVRITSKSFNLGELSVVTKQLATMLKAGLPIVESLQLLAKEHNKSYWQYLLGEIKNKLIKGDPLSRVLREYESIFPPLYREIIATGELTGQLDQSFEQLAVQLEKSLQLQKRIKKALRYPLFLLSVAVIVAAVMLLIVLPKFSDVYASFDTELPFFTQAVIHFSIFLQQNGGVILLLAILIFYLYKRYLKQKYQSKIDRALIKLPLLGKIIQTSCLTQIFQTLMITQKSGIPLLAGLSAAANTAYNSHYKYTIQQIIATIEQGQSLSYAVNQHAIFPSLCFQLIRAGEESGALDLMLDKLANYYQEQNEELTDNLSQKFEPLLMMVLALIIGGLIVAMYLPIFQLGDVIH
ncbi:protein transport protein HofC [Orbaceae bacterium ESL0727]|nr:protein transport protein HofC [Orbaceae bacterium ESL0727]